MLAVLVLREGAQVTPEELWAFFDDRMPAFAVPRFIRIAESLPTTPSGKLRKAPLREQGREGAHDRTALAPAR